MLHRNWGQLTARRGSERGRISMIVTLGWLRFGGELPPRQWVSLCQNPIPLFGRRSLCSILPPSLVHRVLEAFKKGTGQCGSRFGRKRKRLFQQLGNVWAHGAILSPKSLSLSLLNNTSG